MCTRALLNGHSLSPKLNRLSGRSREQPEQQQQQPGLAAQSPEEEGHQVLHRPLVWQEGEGPARTPWQGGVGARWVLHRGEGRAAACPFREAPTPVPRGSCHARWASSWEQERRRRMSSQWVCPPRVIQGLPGGGAYRPELFSPVVSSGQKVGLQSSLHSPPAGHRNTCLGRAVLLLMSRPLCFFVAGISETENSSQDALGLSKLGGQAEKNRKLQKK